MSMRNKYILIVAVLLMSAGCREKKAEQKFQALPFPDVQLPAMIDGQQEMLEYLAENYWNNLTDPSRAYPSDSLLVSGVRRTDVEQKFADWIYVLETAGPAVWEKAMTRLYDRALKCEKAAGTSNVFETFVELAQKYLYDPNSPMRNEDIYLHFVRRYSSYEGLSDVEKEKFGRQARLCALNRVGTVAADFSFADSRGRIRNLHGIDAPLTLLFFSNPGCNACMEIIKVLRENPQISVLIEDGFLAVVNVYIDEDIQAWRSYMPIYPENWYNGFDPDLAIRNSSLYDVRAIPSLYLLDAEKKVILKDAPEHKVFDMISRSVYGTGMESCQ